MITTTRPAELDALRRVDVDVRSDIRAGIEPFSRIMAAVKALGAGDVLVVRAPFEPAPLYDVLGRRGFTHWTECREANDWSVWFFRPSDSRSPAVERDAAAESAPPTIDVRGLEPPQPMMRVLERLETLAPSETLVVLHDRRPMLLYPKLEDRGFAHETDEPEAGLVRIRIRRRTT